MRRTWLIVLCTGGLMMLPGCTRLFGKFAPVETCTSARISTAAALTKAPVWVPGSPAHADMPPGGCVGGDGSHHPDRLCAVADVAAVAAVATSAGLAETRSRRLLGEELERRLRLAAGASGDADQVKDLSKQLVTVIGRVTGTWRSPTCATYAIAEITLSDFRFVMEGPRVSNEVRATLLSHTDTIIGRP